MSSSFLFTLTKSAAPEHIGGKARQIQQLIARNALVPVTHICVWDAYEAFLVDQTHVLATIRHEISEKLDLSKSYAVRSSANVEDSEKFSFAGQFLTLLNVKGIENLLKGIQLVWESTQNRNVQTYMTASGFPVQHLRMAVILQEMVEPVVAGVAFSKNPMTGLDEVVVEAVNGSGELLVQGGVTPDRWVNKWGAWIQRADRSSIDEKIIAEVVAQTRSIAAKCDYPLDLEWVYSGTAVYWVQLREITTLGHLNIYSNRISREVLPGIIKPLVWSINVPLVNSAWIALFTELVGRIAIEPDDLSKSFYYRAYFNMGVIGRIFEMLGLPRETLELMMGLKGGDEAPTFRPSRKVLRHVPRILGFVLAKLGYGRQIDAFLPEMQRIYAAFADQPTEELNPPELLETLEALIDFTRQAATMNIVGPLLMQFYNGRLKRRLAAAGIRYESFDVTHNFANMEPYDPNAHLDRLGRDFHQLDHLLQEQIRAGSYADFQCMPAVPTEFKANVAAFVEQFGHLSESGNDFSKVPWREDPDFVLDMLIHHGKDRQNRNDKRHTADFETDKILTWETAPLGKLARWRIQRVYRRARQFRFYREAISFRYTFGYGLIRNYVLALANHFVGCGILTKPDDIFFLYLSEVRSLVAEENGTDIAALIEKRKQEIAAVEDIVLPEIIFGDEAPPLETYDKELERLQGIASSGGYFKGTVCVIQSSGDYGKMAVDAVLVIPYSDVSWAPLFAKAGAVVAESGGILSHSSILAREYRLPAVVSVNGACFLLKDGMLVTVNGYSGEIYIDSERSS